MDTADFVLQDFNKEEKTNLKDLEKEVNALLSEHIYSNDLLREETRNFIF